MKDYINIIFKKVKLVDIRTRKWIEAFKKVMGERTEKDMEGYRAWRRMETDNVILTNRNRVLEKALMRMTDARELDKRDKVGKKRKKTVEGKKEKDVVEEKLDVKHEKGEKVRAAVEGKQDVERMKGKKEKVKVDKDLTVKGEKERKKRATFTDVQRGRRKILEEIEGKDKARIRECFLWVEYWYNYCKALVVFGIPLWYLLVKKETNYLYDKNTTAVIISHKLAGPCLR